MLIVWVKVPSEKYTVDYDVIFELTFSEGARATASADVRLYCNSPSWVFTTAYATKAAGMLAPGWDAALGRAAIDPPRVTNPNLDQGFDKVVTQAIFFILGPGGLLSLQDLKAASTAAAPNPKDKALWAEAKLFEYQRARDKFAAAARLQRKVDRETKAEDVRTKRAESRTASGAARSAKVAASAKKARTAANATKRKVRKGP